MNLTRRDLAAAGALALSSTTLIVPAMAATGDDEAVKQAVDALRKAILTQDKAKLETLTPTNLATATRMPVSKTRPNSLTGS